MNVKRTVHILRGMKGFMCSSFENVCRKLRFSTIFANPERTFREHMLNQTLRFLGARRRWSLGSGSFFAVGHD